jgi:hypothetical protein
MILQVLKGSNPQLWFTISLRLGKIYLDAGKLGDLDALLYKLKEFCRKSFGSKDDDGDSNMDGDSNRFVGGQWDQSKSHLLLEAFALEI